MYHYRWAYEPDIEKAGQLLPLDQNLQLPEAMHTKAHDFIIERQIGRRAMVGSTDSNTHDLENSYMNTLDILEQHFQSTRFPFRRATRKNRLCSLRPVETVVMAGSNTDGYSS